MCKAARVLLAVVAGMQLLATSVVAQTASAPAQPGATVPAGKPVIGTAARDVFVRPAREALAVVEPRNESRIAAQVSALVSQLPVDVGERVGAGDILARLDDTDIRLSLAEALASQDGLRARLQLARRQLKRLRSLKSNNFVSTEAVNQRDAQVVSLRAELKASDARVAIIRRQLQKCTIRAPFEAVITERAAQLGELAVPGVVLFTLVQIGGEVVSADISMADAPFLTIGAGYEFATGGQSVPLKLQRLSPVVSRQNRSHEARFTFAANQVPIGSEGRVRWPDTRNHLPPSLLVRRGSSLGVFVIRNQVTATFIPIEAAQEGRPVPVTLPGTEILVTSGQTRLQDGDKVSVNKPGLK